jgi:hypothetical protein
VHYRIHPSPNIGARSFGDEVVVANFMTGVYYSLLGSAAQVWEGLMAGQPLDRVAGELATVGGLDEPACVAASEKLVSDLLAEGLIVPDPAPVAGAWNPVAAPPDTRYDFPVLERFTDMQDLLLLDPIHDVEEMGWPHAAPGPQA